MKIFIKCLVLVFCVLSVVECVKKNRRKGGSNHPIRPTQSSKRHFHTPKALSPSPRPNTSSPSHHLGSRGPSGSNEKKKIKRLHSSTNRTTKSQTGPSGPPNYGFTAAMTQNHGGSSTPPPIGFKPSVTQGSNHGSNLPSQTHSAAHKGTSNGTKSHSRNSKPSAPVGPVTKVKPLGNTPPGAPYPSSSHGSNLTSQTHGTDHKGTSNGTKSHSRDSKPIASVEPVTKVKPLGNTPPGAPYPSSSHGSNLTSQTHGTDHKGTSNGTKSHSRDSKPSAPVRPVTKVKPLGNSPPGAPYPSSSHGSNLTSQTHGTPHKGTSNGTKSHSRDSKPSAPVGPVTKVKPLGNSPPGAPYPSSTHGSNLTSPTHGTAHKGTSNGTKLRSHDSKPSAPVGPVTKVNPLGNTPPGAPYPSSSHGLNLTSQTHGTDHKGTSNGTKSHSRDSKPSASVEPVTKVKPLGNTSPGAPYPSSSHGSNLTSKTHGTPHKGTSNGTKSHSRDSKPSAPVGPVTKVKPLGNSPPGAPYPSSTHGSNLTSPTHGTAHKGTSNGTKLHSHDSKPSAPVGPVTKVNPLGNTPPGAPYPIQPPPFRPHNTGTLPPAPNPAGYGPLPAANSGYGHTSQHHAGGNPGTTNIHINNINTHNSNHYPSYHYSSEDTGSGTLGFYLGYRLGKVTRPTYYSHSSFYNGYTPRYDHYEVHHYYHNRKSISAQSTIEPSTIVGCIGDSGAICPTGTTSQCTSNGVIWCVASATTTEPCADKTQGNCIKTTIPCVKGSKDCDVGSNKTVTIPCISSAKVSGNISYVNNTIIVNNTTIINNNFNSAANKTVSTASNSLTLLTFSTVQNGTVPLANLTNSALVGLNNVTGNWTNQTVTTTEFPTTLQPHVAIDGTITSSTTPNLLTSSTVQNGTILLVNLAASTLTSLNNVTGNWSEQTVTTTELPTTLQPNIATDETITVFTSSNLLISSPVQNGTVLLTNLTGSALTSSNNITGNWTNETVTTTEVPTTLQPNVATDGTITVSTSSNLLISSPVQNGTVLLTNLTGSALTSSNNITGNWTNETVTTTEVPTTLQPNVATDGTITVSTSSNLLISSPVQNGTVLLTNLTGSALTSSNNITGNWTNETVTTTEVPTTLQPNVATDGTITVSTSSNLLISSPVQNGTVLLTNLTGSALTSSNNITGNWTNETVTTTEVPTTLQPNVATDETITVSTSSNLLISNTVQNETVILVNLAGSALTSLNNVTGNWSEQTVTTTKLSTTLQPNVAIDGTITVSTSSNLLISSPVQNGTVLLTNLTGSALTSSNNITGNWTNETVTTTEVPTTLQPNVATDETITVSTSSNLLISNTVQNETVILVNLAGSALTSLNNVTGNWSEQTVTTTKLSTTLQPNVAIDGTITVSTSSNLLISSPVQNGTVLLTNLTGSALTSSNNITGNWTNETVTTTEVPTTLQPNVATDETITVSTSSNLLISNTVQNETVILVNLAGSALTSLNNVTGNWSEQTVTTTKLSTTLQPNVAIDGTITVSTSSNLLISSPVQNGTVLLTNLTGSALTSSNNITGNWTNETVTTTEVPTTLQPNVATDETITVSTSSNLLISNTVQNETVILVNLAGSALTSLNNVTGNWSEQTVTTTELSTTLQPNVITDGIGAKRDTPAVPINEFCVTILAVPSKRKRTKQEIVLSKGIKIFTKFLVRALGVN